MNEKEENGMKEFYEERKRQKELRNEIIVFLKTKEATYKDALVALKDAQSRLERASLEHKI